MLPQEDVLKALENLSITERLTIVEEILQQIRVDIAEVEARKAKRADMKQRMAKAAQLALLKDDYANDKDLTSFTALDGEDFYEPG